VYICLILIFIIKYIHCQSGQKTLGHDSELKIQGGDPASEAFALPAGSLPQAQVALEQICDGVSRNNRCRILSVLVSYVGSQRGGHSRRAGQPRTLPAHDPVRFRRHMAFGLGRPGHRGKKRAGALDRQSTFAWRI